MAFSFFLHLLRTIFMSLWVCCHPLYRLLSIKRELCTVVQTGLVLVVQVGPLPDTQQAWHRGTREVLILLEPMLVPDPSPP